MITKLNLVIASLASLLVVFVQLAGAQQASRVLRIGLLHAGAADSPSRHLEAFRHDLAERGFVEGKNIFFEYRFAEGKADRLHILAAELVGLKVDLIVTSGGAASQAAKKATTTIPIVMAGVNDPVRLGLVASLALPGGNITGITDLGPELIGKRLELLKEAVPRLARVAFLVNAAAGSRQMMLTEAEAVGRELGVKLQALQVIGPNPDFAAALRAAAAQRAGAVITSPDPLIASHRKQILQLLAKTRFATMHPHAAWSDDGGLMSYGTDLPHLYRRAAIYVDKILKGKKPAELPVEQPTKFEFVVNLKTAKQIGVTIPPNLLVRADRVIR